MTGFRKIPNDLEPHLCWKMNIDLLTKNQVRRLRLQFYGPRSSCFHSYSGSQHQPDHEGCLRGYQRRRRRELLYSPTKGCVSTRDALALESVAKLHFDCIAAYRHDNMKQKCYTSYSQIFSLSVINAEEAGVQPWTSPFHPRVGRHSLTLPLWSRDTCNTKIA